MPTLYLCEKPSQAKPSACDMVSSVVPEPRFSASRSRTKSMTTERNTFGQFIERQIALIRLATADPQHTLFVSGGSPSTKTSAAPDGEGCPKCARAVVPRKGTYGPFWSCSGYPDCNTTFKDNAGKRGAMNEASASISAPVTPGTIPSTTYACPACNRARIRRPGNDSKSAWWSCSGYANGCTVTASDDNGAPVERIVRPMSTAGKVGEGCPTCKQGKLTQKATQGRAFLGCTQFPTCRHFNWLNA